MNSQLNLFYGGSFNPVHIGHVRLALEICAQINPQCFSFMPCKTWGDKSSFDVTDAQRIAMLDMAVEQLQSLFRLGVDSTARQTKFRVEQSDLTCAGPSYTVNSLSRLAQDASQSDEKHGHDLNRHNLQNHIVWVLGMDSWEALTRWHQWQKLTEYGSLLVVNRPGYSGSIPQQQADWAEPKTVALSDFGQPGSIAFIETTPLHVSSSGIRKLIARRESAKFLLPEPVLRYIEEAGLYKNIGLLSNE